MKLTPEQVRKIAQLARLKLTEEEEQRYAQQLTGILSYVERISELELKDVPETSQVTGLSTVTRADELGQKLCAPEELLECSPLSKVDHQIRIKRMM